ncbi:MAG: tetratricopeptide repeat protein [Campylobacter sp.]
MINRQNLVALLVGVTFATTHSQEVSVYDASNLGDQNPYGSADSKKQVIQSNQLSQSISDIDDSLSQALERIEGLQSVIDGLNAKISKLERRVNDLENGGVASFDTNSSNSEILELRKYVEESRSIQEANNEKITKALQEMGALIDKSNLKKTSEKDDAKSASSKTKDSQATTPDSSKPKKDFAKQKNSDIASEAKKLFDSGKLEDAKDRLEYLISKDFRPALANYYLGEISYQQKLYNNAIKYYQKSIELYDKADYTPKLLYHTAISFDKIKDTQSANRFYKALKLGYPESKEAKASPNRQ